MRFTFAIHICKLITLFCKFADFKSINYICIRFTKQNIAMDIVSRLKKFMTAINLTSSQFADTCLIPRPSFSQILNGRNKKISDEIITKIHDAFPNLSVLWLMFGEGDMTTDTNIEISEGQNAPEININTSQFTAPQPHNVSIGDIYNSTTFSSENFSDKDSATIGIVTNNSTTNDAGLTPKNVIPPVRAKEYQSSKRITNIVVFYDDNSFESFAPSTE